MISIIALIFIVNCVSAIIRTQNCACGIEKVTGRIVNGNVVTKMDKPWVVYISFSSDDFQFCGGNIISNKQILTAAHCVKNRTAADLHVVVLTLNKADQKPENTYGVIKITRNPYFNGTNNHFDAAILELDRKLDLEEITPVCLPEFKFQKYYNLLAMGWGRISEHKRSDVLRQVWLNYTNFDECDKFWSHRLNPIIQFCAGKFNKDTCQGDSGGPLMMRLRGKWILIGLTSFGTKCAENVDAVYTRVAYFVPWIYHIIGQSNGVICKR